MQKLFPIIYEDENLLVVNKPAGLVCHPTKGDEYSSLISRVRIYLGAQCQTHMINRLDRETSGVVVVVKTDETALELRRLWQSRSVKKEYLAIVQGHPEWDTKFVNEPLAKDVGSAVAIKDTVVINGAPSQTEAKVLRRFLKDNQKFSLLKVVPLTGRKHQIRIHLWSTGHPIVGDKLYGGDETLYLKFVSRALTEEDRAKLILENQALHAEAVSMEWKDKTWRFCAELGPELKCFLEM